MKQSKDTKYNSKPQNPISYKHETVFYVKDRKRYAGQLTFCFDEGDHRKTVYGKSEREVRAKLQDLKSQAEAGLLYSDDGSVYRSRYARLEKKADLDATKIMRILHSL